MLNLIRKPKEATHLTQAPLAKSDCYLNFWRGIFTVQGFSSKREVFLPLKTMAVCLLVIYFPILIWAMCVWFSPELAYVLSFFIAAAESLTLYKLIYPTLHFVPSVIKTLIVLGTLIPLSVRRLRDVGFSDRSILIWYAIATGVYLLTPADELSRQIPMAIWLITTVALLTLPSQSITLNSRQAWRRKLAADTEATPYYTVLPPVHAKNQRLLTWIAIFGFLNLSVCLLPVLLKLFSTTIHVPLFDFLNVVLHK